MKIKEKSQTLREKQLVAWVMDNVDRWETHRRTEYDDEWKEFERLVEGEWAPIDKNRDSERSRLVSPALQQAVESAVAELEEAVFGRGTGLWFDVRDDVKGSPEEAAVWGDVRKQLQEDIEFSMMHQEMRRTFWNGCVYGTGISKIIVEKYTEVIPVPEVDPMTGVGDTGTRTEERIRVRLESINPMEFVIDPSARTVEQALGCAHIVMKPRHGVVSKQRQGIYKDTYVGGYRQASNQESNNLYNTDNFSERESNIIEDQVRLVEYHGKVPRALLEKSNPDDYTSMSLIDYDNTDMVEALITIGNDTILLKAEENPMILKDRSIVAYQHDTVNNSFWGRGVCKKGYNPQKALDAELRARIDAMALTVHPMVGLNATMIPRGFKAEVRPGKTWLFNGDPRAAMMPFTLGNVSQESFPQAADLERMVSMGAGAMDTAAPQNVNPRNQTASGMSMMTSQFVKRSKRTMRNIEEDYLDHIVRKTAHRYMQFDPQRYPVMDYRFKVTCGMGIMARELEQGQLTQLLSIIPPDSPVFGVILEGIFENSSLTNKTELQAALRQQMAPPSEEQQKAQQEQQELQKRGVMAEIEETESKKVKNLADAQSKMINAETQSKAVGVNMSKVLVDANKAQPPRR